MNTNIRTRKTDNKQHTWLQIGGLIILLLLTGVVNHLYNEQTSHSSVINSTKGCPRESPKYWLLPNYNTGTRTEIRKKKKSKITNSRMEYRINNTFDSTKGYPGEGPEMDKPREKKQEKSTIKGDEKYKTALLQWREKERIQKELG